MLWGPLDAGYDIGGDSVGSAMALVLVVVGRHRRFGKFDHGRNAGYVSNAGRQPALFTTWSSLIYRARLMYRRA